MCGEGRAEERERGHSEIECESHDAVSSSVTMVCSGPNTREVDVRVTVQKCSRTKSPPSTWDQKSGSQDAAIIPKLVPAPIPMSS